MGAENIRIGACRVTWGGTDLGYTQGGVVVNIDVSASPANHIGYPTDYEYRVESTGVTVTCPLAEGSVNNILLTTPWETTSISAGQGVLLRQYAKALILTPLVETTEIVTVPMAVPISSVSLEYSSSPMRVIELTFRALTKTATDETLIEFG